MSGKTSPLAWIRIVLALTAAVATAADAPWPYLPAGGQPIRRLWSAVVGRSAVGRRSVGRHTG